MKKFTRKQFEKLAAAGSIHQVTGKAVPGEHLCQTQFEFGIANGYSLADICRFYAHVRGYGNDLMRHGRTDRQALDEAYEQFVHHACYFGGTVVDAAPEVEKRITAKKPATKKAVRARKHNQD